MHPRTVILKERFWHESHRETILNGNILGDVLVHHYAVCLFEQGIKSHTEFYLAAGSYFMMMFLDVNSCLYHLECHFSPDVVHLVGRRHREISFFMTGAVAQIGFRGITGVPDSFLRVDFVETHMAVSIKGNAIEDEEFQFRSPIAGIGNTGRFEVSLGFPGHITGVAVVVLTIDGVSHITDEAQSRR